LRKRATLLEPISKVFGLQTILESIAADDWIMDERKNVEIFLQFGHIQNDIATDLQRGFHF
jgi:hypothetical protein